jgi:Fe-S-cluster-containing hydrogenase component 2
MVYVNDTACNGCGDCVDVCPTGALIFQNNHAFIQQDICEGCEVCIDACPHGAILSEEIAPVSQEVIRIPETPATGSTSLADHVEQVPIREIVLPAIGSMLLWTGRELVPRLAEMALRYLDRRNQSLAPNMNKQNLTMRDRQPSKRQGNGQRRRQRQRRKRNR